MVYTDFSIEKSGIRNSISLNYESLNLIVLQILIIKK